MSESLREQITNIISNNCSRPGFDEYTRSADQILSLIGKCATEGKLNMMDSHDGFIDGWGKVCDCKNPPPPEKYYYCPTCKGAAVLTATEQNELPITIQELQNRQKECECGCIQILAEQMSLVKNNHGVCPFCHKPIPAEKKECEHEWISASSWGYELCDYF